MRLALILVSIVVVFAGVASGAGFARTRLTITVYPAGIGRPGALHYWLGCDPTAGTVPQPLRACTVLSRLSHPFAPVPLGTFCTDIALGPEEATVVGRLRGVRVRAYLMVRGGCEIERWRRVEVVVPDFPGR